MGNLPLKSGGIEMKNKNPVVCTVVNDEVVEIAEKDLSEKLNKALVFVECKAYAYSLDNGTKGLSVAMIEMFIVGRSKTAKNPSPSKMRLINTLKNKRQKRK